MVRQVDAIDLGGATLIYVSTLFYNLLHHCMEQTLLLQCCAKHLLARNVFIEMKRTHTRFSSCDILEFNANKVFGINANACLLIIELSSADISAEISANICNVYSFDKPKEVKNSFGYINGKLYSNTNKKSDDFSGNCCFEWRQGVKHDCSKVMELSLNGTSFVNGLNESVDIEEDMFSTYKE